MPSTTEALGLSFRECPPLFLNRCRQVVDPAKKGDELPDLPILKWLCPSGHAAPANAVFDQIEGLVSPMSAFWRRNCGARG